MWNGQFAKHRDYEHATFAEHEMANGASYQVDTLRVRVERNPIDYALFSPSRGYYFVDFTTHTGSVYRYLVPQEPDRSPPNRKRVLDTINEYAANPVEGGRDWMDYLDLDDSDTASHPFVVSTTAGSFWNRMLA